jgi:hypothetical protein
MCVSREGLEVADAAIARASAEHFIALGREQAERGVTASAAAADHESCGVCVRVRDQPARAGDGVLDVGEAPLLFEPQPGGAAVACAAAISSRRALQPGGSSSTASEAGGRSKRLTLALRDSSRAPEPSRPLAQQSRAKREDIERMGRPPDGRKECDWLGGRNVAVDVLVKEERSTQDAVSSLTQRG